MLHAVQWANDDWLDFCGFSAAEICGQSLKVLQGPATNRETLDEIKQAALKSESVTVTLVNYTKHAVPFQHTITIEPLVDSTGRPCLYKVGSSNVVSATDLGDAMAAGLQAAVGPAAVTATGMGLQDLPMFQAVA